MKSPFGRLSGKYRIRINITYLFFVAALSLSSTASHAQKLLQIKKKLYEAASDTAKASALYSLSHYYWSINNDSAMQYADSSLRVSTRVGFRRGVALAMLSKGVIYGYKGEYIQALEHQLNALKISEEEKIQGLSANCLSNIGIIYATLNEHEEALKYHIRALNLIRAIDPKANLAPLLINLGDTYLKLNETVKAIDCNSQALHVASARKDTLMIAIALFNLGETYLKSHQYEEAERYLRRSLATSKVVGDMEGVMLSYDRLSNIQLGRNHFTQSITLADSARELALKLKRRDILVEIYNTLYRNSLALKNLAKAIDYRNREIELRDSLVNKETRKEIEKLQALYQLEKKQTQLNIQQGEIRAARKSQSILIISLILFLGLILYLIGLGKRGKRLNISLIERNLFIHNLNHEINKQNKELTRLNAVKNKLMSIVSHDIRGPLNQLKGLTDLIQHENLSLTEVKLLTQKISTQLTITNSFIENLLFWAKSQMDGESINATTFDMAELSLNIIHQVKPAAEAKGITIVNGMDQQQVGYADPSTVEIILRNLLTNAIKFSKPNGHVELLAAKEGDFLRIHVKDNGIGMASEKSTNLFTGAVESGLGTANERGVGIGLMLSKELVEKNGGTISVSSQPGKGSDFSFTIPLQTQYPITFSEP